MGSSSCGGLGLGRGAAQCLVAQRGQPGRDLVDGRGRDDQDAEDAEQRQQRHDDVRRLHQVEQQARGDVADGAAGGLQVGGVAELGLRVAVGDVHDAEQAQGEGGPADDLATGGAVALGVAQRAPAGVDEEQRDEPADLADRAGGHRAGELHDPAGQLPPHGGGDDHGEAEEEEADTVSTVLGVEVARRLPDRPRDRADGVGDAEPDGGDTPPERAEGARDRAGAVAHGTRCRTRGAARLDALERLRLLAFAERGACWYSGIGCSKPWFAATGVELDVLELREPGGEDVRVAMVRPYGQVTPATGITRLRVVDLRRNDDHDGNAPEKVNSFENTFAEASTWRKDSLG